MALGEDGEEDSPERRGTLGALGAAQAVVSLTGLVAQVLLARWLGEAGYGLLGVVVVAMGLWAFLGDLNLQILTARSVALRPEVAARILGIDLRLVLPGSAVAAGLLVATLVVLDGRPEAVLAAALGGLALAGLSVQTVIEGALHGLRWGRPLVGATLLGRLVYAVGGPLLVLAGGGVAAVLLAQAVGAVLTVAWLGVALRRRLGPLGGGWRAVPGRLREAAPYALNRLFGAVWLTADVLVIKALLDDAEVGLYRVASLLLLQVPVVAAVLGRAALPVLATAASEPERARKHLGRGLRVLVALSLPVGLGGVLVAGDLVPAVFGGAYAAAVPAFALLVAMVPVRVAHTFLGAAASAMGLQASRTWATGAAAVGSLGLTLALVPGWGAWGAAVATALADGLLLAWLGGRLARRLPGPVPVAALARQALPVFALACALAVSAAWPVAGRVVVGAVVYLIVLLASGAVRRADLEALRSL